MRDQHCVTFLKWCLPQLGLSWAGFRKVRGTVYKRLRRRLNALGLTDLDAYRDYLRDQVDEWRRLDELCRIPISRFYRDKGVFEALGRQVLPELARHAQADGRRSIRAWSAGCASGEEPYSLRLVWDQMVQPAFPATTLVIFATEIDPVMLERARTGSYGSSSLEDLPAGWQTTAFVAKNGQYCLGELHRRDVAFDQQDIRKIMPDGPFELILCRNLAFTYFDEETQNDVLRRLVARLALHGALVIGAHEQLPCPADALRPLSKGLPIYIKGSADQASG